jgi:hypothetical protein
VTNQHPITPPPELVTNWLRHRKLLDPQPLAHHYLASRAAQWGSDQELEACIEWVSIQLNCTSQEHLVPHLRAARRPKPPSLKEQAFKDLDELLRIARQAGVFNPPDNIRRALEALPND